jgi:hypothetical protein
LCIVQRVTLTSEISKQMEDGVYRRRTFRAEASVRESFKGESDSSLKINLVVEDGWGPMLQAGEIVLLFLKRSSGETYAVSDEWIGVTRFTTLMYAEGEGLAKLESALRQELFSGEETDQLAALNLLHGFEHLAPLTWDTVSTFVSTGSTENIRVQALAIMIKFTRPQQGLAALIRYLEEHAREERPIAWSNVGSDVSVIRDRSALKLLEALTATQDQEIRLTAMQAVRNMHDPSSAAALIKRLDDRGESRYQAVITLYEIFGGPDQHGPSMPLFEKQPDRYVAFWKRWWSEREQAR